MSIQQNQTVRSISASEAKSRFGSILSWAKKNKNEVIVHVYGKPTGVVMSYDEYKKVQALREKERRQKIWQEMETIRKSIS